MPVLCLAGSVCLTELLEYPAIHFLPRKTPGKVLEFETDSWSTLGNRKIFQNFLCFKCVIRILNLISKTLLRKAAGRNLPNIPGKSWKLFEPWVGKIV